MIKTYEQFNTNDPYGEEIWDEKVDYKIGDSLLCKMFMLSFSNEFIRDKVYKITKIINDGRWRNIIIMGEHGETVFSIEDIEYYFDYIGN